MTLMSFFLELVVFAGLTLLIAIDFGLMAYKLRRESIAERETVVFGLGLLLALGLCLIFFGNDFIGVIVIVVFIGGLVGGYLGEVKRAKDRTRNNG